MWSHHYDDSLANMFQVQDKITASIADALKVKFASLGTTRSVNPEAHDLVLKARALIEKGRSAAPHATNYLDLGEYAQALAPSLALIKLAPHSASAAFGLAQSYALLHHNQDAARAFDLVQPDTPLGKQLSAAGKLAYQSVLDPKLHAQALAAADALCKRSDLDPDSLYNLVIVYLVLDKKDIALDLLDRSCAPTPFSCNDFAINPTYIPLRGDPRFEAMAKKYDATSQPAASASTSASPR
jgi:tetratricopeptide (TPR) repeat protein